MSSESDETSVLSDEFITKTESDSNWLSKFTESSMKIRDYEDGDIYSELEQKDRDLQLAAELGKVLVQENEDLKQINRQQIENFNLEFEELNQEIYHLKSRLDALSTEYQLSKTEHQLDIETVKEQLAEEQKRARSREREDRQYIEELVKQNEKLTDQLLNDSHTEERARSQVNALRLNVAAASETESILSEQLEALRSEMTELKAEKDIRLVLKDEECDKLAHELQRALERIASLEKDRAADAEKMLHDEEELRRQEDINMQLLLKLENLSTASGVISPVALTQETSLFAELELLSHSMSVSSFDNRQNGKVTIGMQLKQEILEVYRQLQRLTMEVQGRGDEWSPEFVEISDLKAGQLLTMLTDLRSSVQEQLKPTTSNNHKTEKGTRVDGLLQQISSAQAQLNAAQSRSNSLESELAQRDRQLLRKCDELKQLEMQYLANRVDLMKMRKDRDCLLDKSAGIQSPDRVLEQTRTERDEALKSNEDLVSQLSKLRLDLATLDRQLLDAVSQKLLLSQQLEAWQNDMENLIDIKMANEIARDKVTNSNASTISAQSKIKGANRLNGVSSSPSNKTRFSLWRT